jgi:hypothetical protein
MAFYWIKLVAKHIKKFLISTLKKLINSHREKLNDEDTKKKMHKTIYGWLQSGKPSLGLEKITEDNYWKIWTRLRLQDYKYPTKQENSFSRGKDSHCGILGYDIT